MKIEYIDMRGANATEISRVEHTTQLAAISRGKHMSNNPPKRYRALLEEAAGHTPSRPLEFLPVIVDPDRVSTLVYDRLKRFSFMDKGRIYTNMRACINAGMPYEQIPYNEDTGQFVAFRLKVPMFVWAQIVTHTQLSTESQSDRVATETEYWVPEDIEEKTGMTKPEFWDFMLHKAPQTEVQELLKGAGYPLEIYSRFPYYTKMKEFVITGWINDALAWPHFMKERNACIEDGHKNWTQEQTAEVVRAMKVALEEHGHDSLCAPSEIIG